MVKRLRKLTSLRITCCIVDLETCMFSSFEFGRIVHTCFFLVHFSILLILLSLHCVFLKTFFSSFLEMYLTYGTSEVELVVRNPPASSTVEIYSILTYIIK